MMMMTIITIVMINVSNSNNGKVFFSILFIQTLVFLFLQSRRKVWGGGKGGRTSLILY
jgi:hypothetical protein